MEQFRSKPAVNNLCTVGKQKYLPFSPKHRKHRNHENTQNRHHFSTRLPWTGTSEVAQFRPEMGKQTVMQWVMAWELRVTCPISPDSYRTVNIRHVIKGQSVVTAKLLEQTKKTTTTKKHLDNTITVHKLAGDSVKHFSRGKRYKNQQIFSLSWCFRSKSEEWFNV